MNVASQRKRSALMNLTDAKILVTGADGVIGSRLPELAERTGASVRALVQYNSFNSWGWLDDISAAQRMEVVAGDVRDPNFCRDLVAGVDIVFHLAALIPIPYSYAAPDSYVDTNVRGTLNMCRAALAAGTVKRFIQTSTSEVYGTAQYVPIDEKHPLNAQSPYSATKIGSDAIAHSFYCAFGLPVVTARPFNVYGPRQSARAVIPTIISQVASGIDNIRLGELRSTRDLSFVEDACAFLAVARMATGAGDVFNIGTGREISIGDLVEMIGRLMGRRVAAVQDSERVRAANSEVLRLLCDNRKLLAASGFAPSITLEDGFSRTIDWFARPENLRRYKPHTYNA